MKLINKLNDDNIILSLNKNNKNGKMINDKLNGLGKLFLEDDSYINGVFNNDSFSFGILK